MANGRFNGVNATNIAASIPKLAEQGQQGGIKKVIYDTYVLTADLAAGDQINVGGLIPAGAMLVDCVLTLPALGGSCTLDVGILAGAAGLEAADADLFFNTVVASSAIVHRHGSISTEGDYYGHIMLEAAQAVIAEHAVSSGATGLAISIEIHYFET